MCITDKTRNLLLQKELRDEHERHTEDELSKQSEYNDKTIHLSLSSRYQSLFCNGTVTSALSGHP